MTKTILIIGAIVLVGVGIAAGLLFTGGAKADPAIATPGKGQGTEAATVAETAVQTVAVVEANVEPVETVVQTVETPPVVQEAVEIADTSEPVAEPATDVVAVSGPIVVGSLDELIADSRKFDRKEVIVRGTIVTQCISGCTFSLEDGTGVVAVEMIDDALDNVLSGGSVGREVEVRGMLEATPRVVILLDEPEDWEYLD